MSSDQYSVNQSSAPVASSEQDPRRPRGIVSAMGRIWRITLLTLLMVYFALCMMFLALRYVVLPNINQYKPHIEKLASKGLGQSIAIGEIAAAWQGLSPQLILTDVVIHDREGEQALHLSRVSALVSWWSAAVADLRLKSLEIIRPDLDIVRDKDGHLFIAGVPIDLTREGDGKSLDWLLKQSEIVIRDGRLQWNDYRRNALELVLDEVELVLRNSGNRHQFSLKASPPDHIATPLDVRADFYHPFLASRFSDARQWKGTLYADWGNTDLSAWKSYIDYPFEVMAGKGAVQTWLYFDRTQVTNFIADISLKDLTLRMRDDLEVLDLVQAQGRILVQEANGPQPRQGDEVFGQHGYTVALSDVSFQARNGLELPPSTVSQTYYPPMGEQPERREVTATALDVGALAQLAGYLPLSKSDRQFLSDFAPRGQLHDFYAQSEGTYPAISSYRVQGYFKDLGLNAQAPRPAVPKSGNRPAQLAVPGIPGFEKVSGYVSGNETGGEVRLDSAGAIIHLPGYFPDAVMPFERLDLEGQWSWEGINRFTFQIDKMEFVQEGTAGSLSGRHTMSLDEPKGGGTIDMVAHVPNFDIKRLGRYLPSITPHSLHDWLSTALVGGQMQDAKVVLKGNLADFPFNPKTPSGKPTGEFSATARIKDGVLNYLPDSEREKPIWPLLEKVNGRLDINRTRLSIKADSAMTHQVALKDIQAVIPDLVSRDATLQISGKAAGKLHDFVRYTQDSPVAGWIGHVTETSKASGDAKLALDLTLPLHELTHTQVQGTVDFAKNDIQLFDFLPPLEGTTGRLSFNEKGFGLEEVRAQFAGGRVNVSGGMRPNGTVEVRALGGLSTQALATVFPGQATERLLQHIVGSTRYQALIRIRDKHPEVIVDTSLQGVGLDFPDPLQKQPGEVLPTRVEWRMLDPVRRGTYRDELKIAMGKTFAAHYTREKPENKEASWKVVRGGIGINVPAYQPDTGLFAHVDLPTLDLDTWLKTVQGLTGGKQGKLAGGDQSSAYGEFSQYLEPDTVAAQADQLIAMGKKLDKVVVGASRRAHVWQANIDSAQASGYVNWNTGDSEEASGKVMARLSSLIIPESAKSDVTELLEGGDKTTELPALDIVADNVELGAIKLGRLQLVANNSYTSGRRAWHIEKLLIANPDATLSAQGQWTSFNHKHRSSLEYILNIQDAGGLLNRLGFQGVLRRGKGTMTGNLHWDDLPFALHIPSLGGDIKLELAEGQFIKVEPGAAKLLGVLSLQSLPRRLALDFRDIFSEGLAFDTMAGTADIAQGVMSTDNFKMRSVNVAVLLDGKVDVNRETQDLRVVVVPEINAGGAAVVYGLVANPVVGLGSFLAQLFLSDPLRRAFTVEYEITGPWNDPAVHKAEHKSSNGAHTSDKPLLARDNDNGDS